MSLVAIFFSRVKVLRKVCKHKLTALISTKNVVVFYRHQAISSRFLFSTCKKYEGLLCAPVYPSLSR